MYIYIYIYLNPKNFFTTSFFGALEQNTEEGFRDIIDKPCPGIHLICLIHNFSLALVYFFYINNRAIDVMVEPQENVNPIQELTLKQENGSGGSSSEQIGDKKKGGRTKANPETDLAKSTATDLDRVVEKDPREVSSPSQQENPDVNISPKSVMNNGVACALTNSKSIKKQEDAECSNHSEGLNISGHEVRNDLDSEKVDNSNDKETEKKLKNNSKKVSSSPHEDHLVEAAGPSENDKEVDAKTLSPTVYNNESEVASPLSKNLHGGGKTKANPETDLAKSTATDVDREVVSSPRPGTKSTKDESSEETPKTNLKRKHSSGKENESDVKDYGENLEDCEFYKGVIHFSYSGKKKRKVLYDDGDEETLNLGKEKWKLIEVQMKKDKVNGKVLMLPPILLVNQPSKGKPVLVNQPSKERWMVLPKVELQHPVDQRVHP
ncbi:sister chromatid cohesion protein PDS5 homolog C-like isoform X2 [Vigna angularis]|uniref:sister chromatid cohesion protein PDS5 homolog C-like isoform X2 n=1 Tax=Phaseolus angularis TaxID=3914 RepID=UPI0022B2B0E6|nr:sister chromatid cohesion protein PDS5 homolog C-like isoform X2 [Vigna angularis]